MRYLHTMVRVSDLDASLEFYCHYLGMEIVSRQDYTEGKFTLVMLTTPKDKEAAHGLSQPMLELTHNWDNQAYKNGRSFLVI